VAASRPDHIREGYVSVPGGRVWYRIMGAADAVPLLTLHGGPGAGHDYLEPLEALASDRPVVFYDQLGCGRSEQPADRSLWQMDRFVAEIGAVRGALGLERIHLLGHSWALGREVHVEAGEIGALPRLALLGRRNICGHFFDHGVLADFVQDLVQTPAPLQIEALDHRLQPGLAEYLLLHGYNSLGDVLGDHRFHVALGDLLLLHQYLRLRGVLWRKRKRDEKSHQRGNQRRQHNHLQAPVKDGKIIIQRQFTIRNHAQFSLARSQADRKTSPTGSDEDANPDPRTQHAASRTNCNSLPADKRRC
jgi:hypothetical protein